MPHWASYYLVWDRIRLLNRSAFLSFPFELELLVRRTDHTVTSCKIPRPELIILVDG